jgi:hypothetical protein
MIATYKDPKYVSYCKGGFGSRCTGNERIGKSASKEECRPDHEEDKCAPSMHSARPSCITEQVHWIVSHREQMMAAPVLQTISAAMLESTNGDKCGICAPCRPDNIDKR